MQNIIAIRKENIELTEKRSPLSPSQVGRLISEHQMKVLLEPWDRRRFNQKLYRDQGVQVQEDLSDANIIFGVKEIPIDDLPENQAAVFFSHTIKGQSYNMPLLQAILDKNVTLIDYEKITDDQGKRLVFFGPFAGMVGAINSIWLLGQRLLLEGIENPFQPMQQANSYASLEEIKEVLAQIKQSILQRGLPDTGKPWVVVITGNGTVSKGAQEIIDLLPVEALSPVEFRRMQAQSSFDMGTLYKVVIDCDHFVRPVDTQMQFEWSHYYSCPEQYEANFSDLLVDTTVLINGIYWDTQYPRLVTKQDIQTLYENEQQPNLRVIADITCDVEGSVECNLKSTASDNPVYVFDAFAHTIEYGIEGNGPVILAVDKLPSELPVEATEFFGNSLMPYMPGLAQVDFSQSYEDLQMPAAFKRAVITHQGRLTPDFSYLQQHLK